MLVSVNLRVFFGPQGTFLGPFSGSASGTALGPFSGNFWVCIFDILGPFGESPGFQASSMFLFALALLVSVLDECFLDTCRCRVSGSLVCCFLFCLTRRRSRAAGAAFAFLVPSMFSIA